MPNPRTDRFSGRRATRVAAAAVVATLALTSCGGSESSSSDTTAKPTATTVTAPATTAATPTTAAASTTSDGTVAVDDLKGLLPDAATLGPDYRIEDEKDDDGDDGINAATEKACPALAELVGSDDPDVKSTKAVQEFTTEDGRSIKVSLNPDVTKTNITDEADMKKMFDAVNDCGTIEFTSNGIEMSMKLSASMDSGFGDFGGVIMIDATGKHPKVPVPLEMEGVMRAFAVGKVGVSTVTFSGLDDDTFEKIPADTDVAEVLAGNLETGVRELLKG